MKYKYNGTDERVFPGVKVTVKPGDEFDAPDGFKAANVIAVAEKTFTAKPTEPKEEPKEEPKPKEKITMSAASDHKLGDE
jgi:hypothetical protein